MKYSSYQKKPKTKKNRSHIPVRLNILFFVVFILFVSLILRLAYLQIIRGDEFVDEVQRTETILATGNVPRGEIYDSQNRKLVSNDSKPTITYTRGIDVSTTDMAQVAFNLATYIEMPHVTALEEESGFDLSVRDLKDYIIASNSDVVNDRLTDDEKQLSGSELYETQLAKVSDEEVQQLNEKEQNAAAIFKSMNSGYALSTVNIKNDGVTQEEIANVSENLDKLPGVGTGADWERTYPLEGTLRSVLGSVTSEDQGIPEAKEETYLAHGYSRNDRVGQSYLEEQYESVLKGTKSQSYTETNINGEITNQIEKYPGQKGHNLVLNIDIGFQATLEQIATDYLENYQMGLNDSIYIAAMDPNNGDVLSLVGKKIDLETGEITDDALGTFTRSFETGSVVKGATVLSAMMDGVLSEENNVIVDTPLFISGTSPIRSVFNPYGSEPVDDITALEVTSNIYMSKLAMRMGGVWNFQNGSGLSLDAELVIDKFRYYFSQFGLGVPTGIDLPGEQVGFKGDAARPGQALYYSFGQYDSYTPLQLTQYVSTIANGGIRYAPNVVSEIRGTSDDGSIGPLLAQNEPRVLNVVNVTEDQMNRVQEGFRRVVNGDRGTARNFFQGTEYEAAGKTGTAETYYYGEDEDLRETPILNRLFVGYAPFDNPEIAISVIVPGLPASNSNYEINNVARRVFDAYFQVGEYEDLNSQIAGEFPVEGVEAPKREEDDEIENTEEENSN